MQPFQIKATLGEKQWNLTSWLFPLSVSKGRTRSRYLPIAHCTSLRPLLELRVERGKDVMAGRAETSPSCVELPVHLCAEQWAPAGGKGIRHAQLPLVVLLAETKRISERLVNLL